MASDPPLPSSTAHAESARAEHAHLDSEIGGSVVASSVEAVPSLFASSASPSALAWAPVASADDNHPGNAADSSDRRARRVDRRIGDRRIPKSDGRRRIDGSSRRRRTVVALLGTVFCFVAAGLAMWAFVRAPVVYRPHPACNEGLGGQRIATRELSMLWLPVMLLAALGIAMPDARRRPILLVLLCGTCLGLFLAAFLNRDTWDVGLCIV